MKALILNSGLGRRMGNLTGSQPKCMTEISLHETVISRQLRLLADFGVTEIIVTTGPFEQVLVNYCNSLDLPVQITYIRNPEYKETNYIYSIYLAGKEMMQEDILLLHGDLVFENGVLERILSFGESCMAVSSKMDLPKKDFKAVIEGGVITKVGIQFFNNALAAQPLYYLQKKEWKVWLDKIIEFCESGNCRGYAEDALNEVAADCRILPLDLGDALCREIDTPEDLRQVSKRLAETEKRTVYMCFSTDILHSGHISLIKKAARLGRLVVGVLSDEAVASYKRFPLMPCRERMALFASIAGVSSVVEQKTLSYKENLEKLRPDFVVHGDDWKKGVQKTVRDEVAGILVSYGGKLVEYPYADNEKYAELERRARSELSLPDMRRSRLKNIIEMKGLATAIEAHSGITGLIAEKTVVSEGGKSNQFDAMWVSSLCDSVAKGKPDIELVDMTSRFRTIDDIMEVTTKPIIFDGDTGGLTEHFVYTVKTLERMGVSAVIIEDKTGLKRNSLFGTEAEQMQDSIEHFSDKIRAGKMAKKTMDFMIIARIESLILERGMDDALERAFAYSKAGADGIMIHSRKKDPAEIFEFVDRFRREDAVTPIVVVPTSFNTVTEDEFKEHGVNIVIYANQLMRSGFPAMQRTAETILRNRRAKEADEMCMPIKEIITLIPEED